MTENDSGPTPENKPEPLDLPNRIAMALCAENLLNHHYDLEDSIKVIREKLPPAAPALTWMRNQPTVDGWYWQGAINSEKVEILKVWKANAGFIAQDCNGDEWYIKDFWDGILWAGPIPLPTDTKERG